MVIKVYISGISASKEVKKRQQRAQMILDSLRVKYELIDITEPGHETEKELMKNVCKKRNNSTIALPPQFFNDDEYCGDYEDFELASDDDTVLSFLNLQEDITIENGDIDQTEATEGNINTDVVTNGQNENNESIELVKNDNEITNDDNTGDDIISETVDEVVVVEEILKVGGKRVEIPKDRKLEIGGETVELDKLLNKPNTDNNVEQ